MRGDRGNGGKLNTVDYRKPAGKPKWIIRAICRAYEPYHALACTLMQVHAPPTGEARDFLHTLGWGVYPVEWVAPMRPPGPSQIMHTEIVTHTLLSVAKAKRHGRTWITIA